MLCASHNCRSLRRAALTAPLLLLLLARPSAAEPELSTAPDPVVLGNTQEVRIEIRGLPRWGKVQAAVNVGKVESSEEQAGVLALRYRLPKPRFPQVLCLLLWPETAPPRVFRVPLLGRAEVPILTRPGSQVTLTVGGREFGPVPSGTRGQLTITALVPPGVTRGEATVVDSAGLTTRKLVEIRRSSYRELALAVRPARASAPRVSFEVALANAEATDPRPVLEVRPPEGEPVRLQLRAEPSGVWRATWTPDRRPASGRLELRSWLERAPEEAQTALAEILPLPVPVPPPTVVRPPEPPPRRPRRLLGRVALSTGLVHNLGALVSPRFGLEAGADYPLGPGRIGLQLGASVAWSSYEVPVSTGTPPRTSLLLVPIGIGLSYRLSLGRITPTLATSFVAGFARSWGEGESSGRFLRTDLVPGFRAALGCELGLGPGGAFLQVGYELGRLDAPEIEGRVGGLLVELGYRLQI